VRKLVYRIPLSLTVGPVWIYAGDLKVKPSLFKTPDLRGVLPLAVTTIALVGLSACNSGSTLGSFSPGETLTQGYVIDQQQIDLVPVGSSREQVLLALGSPSTTATFDSEVLYYISQTRYRPVAFAKAKLIDQRILAVYLGEDGRVTNIANYGLKDGRVFDFVSRTTPTAGKDQNFIGQVLAGATGMPGSIPGVTR